jgi:hypothetical protein
MAVHEIMISKAFQTILNIYTYSYSNEIFLSAAENVLVNFAWYKSSKIAKDFGVVKWHC